ncbi:MAG: DUF6145 family protein [Lachnospiraceae bacterium]|jgi:hypothetical protein|nr:DUF6145 family protein [Lachnospiraceae bacterium]MEE3461651.1 DUF6145 family protein [Lachnospiraceae bacterium]
MDEEIREELEDDMIGDNIVLAVSNSYEKMFYLGRRFTGLPDRIKDEIKILCVLFTEDVGGILTMSFDSNGKLDLTVTSKNNDPGFDDIGSVIKIQKMQREQEELFSQLETYFQAKYM